MSEYQTYSKLGNFTFNQYLGKVFGISAIGLGISAFVSIISMKFYQSFVKLLGMSFVFLLIGLMVAEIAIAIILSAKLNSLSKTTCWILYILYSVLTGLTLSFILVEYISTSVWLSFGATMILFICMAIIGKTTRIDLSKFSGMAFSALITIIVVSIINFFLKSSIISWGLTYVGIIIFLVITAMDIQKLKNYYATGITNNEIEDKLMIMGAFQLYLDFINLFIRILSIFGKRKNN